MLSYCQIAKQLLMNNRASKLELGLDFKVKVAHIKCLLSKQNVVITSSFQ